MEKREDERSSTLQERFEGYLAEHQSVAGSIHKARGDLLELAAAVNLPDSVREVVALVPRGKGMAGLAFARGVAVTTCDLQTDPSGDVQPGARAVNASAAVALPLVDRVGAVRAVVGLAFAEEREIGPMEIERYTHSAEERLGAWLESATRET